MKLFFSNRGPLVAKKQKGFTLLELLVVITLLAILSVGALVAYEGIGENAQNIGAANNIVVSDSAIRSYAALEGEYPNQWDNLVNMDDGSINGFIAPQTADFLTSVDLNAIPTANQPAVINAMVNAGIDEFQSLLSTSAFPENAIPNEQWNESAPGVTNPADELEVQYTPATSTVAASVVIPAGEGNISAFVSGGDGTNGCIVGTAGPSLATNKAATPVTFTNSLALNRINDRLENDGCHLVLAVGFGKDVPGTTLNSQVAISTAPTFVSDNINPSVNYARYIALFHIGSDDEDVTPGTVTEFRNKAKLIAMVDTEGRNIDQAINGAFEDNN